MSAVTDALRKRPRKIASIGAIALALSVVGVGLGASAAQARDITYVNAQMVPGDTARDSGMRARITGGTAATDLGLGITRLITYYPAPGYREVGSASGDNPFDVRLTHLAATTAHSKCFWSFGSVGGEAEMTCSYKN